jgi:acyl-CoA dehydrogenase
MAWEHKLWPVNGFLQEPPRLPDAWDSDATLRESIEFHIGEDLWDEARSVLAPIGRTVTSEDVLALGMQAEAEPPRLSHYSTWGGRVDDIWVSPAYKELGRIGVEMGVTAIPYEGSPFKERARIVWAGVLMLWGPSSALYSCPIAMTDAAARTLMLYGGDDESGVVSRLTTRDANEAWTSGQWMTETAGGSDVGRTGTTARRDADGSWRLTGTKWFTSSTTSEMALTLARPEGAPQGSRGLGLFMVHRHLEDGTPNRISVRRLKDKLGTRALPTAELELEDALAIPIGDPMDGGGLRRIATMLNITRLHNAVGAAGALGRGLAWARAYADVREVFGKPLREQPAHQATLTDLVVDHAAALALVMRVAELTGRTEQGVASDGELALLRGLTPVAKLATARWAVAGTAEAMESLGGVGYCEDSGLPAVVRNAHVLPIWEGTTNVLALDLLRAAQRAGSLEALIQDASATAARVKDHPAVAKTCAAVESALAELGRRAAGLDAATAESNARSLAMGIATTYACARLTLQGAWAADRGDMRTAHIASRLAQRGLVGAPGPEHLLLFEG